MSNYKEIKIPKNLSDEDLEKIVNTVVNRLIKEEQITTIKSFDKKQRLITEYYRTTSRQKKKLVKQEKKIININGREVDLFEYHKKKEEIMKILCEAASKKIKSKNKGKKLDVRDYIAGSATTFGLTNPLGQCILSLVGLAGLTAIIYIEFKSSPEDRIKYKEYIFTIVDKVFTEECQKTILGTGFFGVPMAIHGGVKGGIIYATGSILSGVASVIAGPAVAGVISTWATWTAMKTFQLDIVKDPLLSCLCAYYKDSKTLENWIGTIISFPIPEKFLMDEDTIKLLEH